MTSVHTQFVSQSTRSRLIDDRQFGCQSI